MTNYRLCGACKTEMTPENSTVIPEMFLCDECAKLHGYSRQPWFQNGFGLRVIDGISRRVPNWESGIFHKGGIATGTWVLAYGLDAAKAKEIEAILSLYSTEKAFLADN